MIEIILDNKVENPDYADTPLFYYGMRLRGFSLGCQPMNGFLSRIDDTSGRYHDILVYNRELSEKELRDYELNVLKNGLEIA